MTSDLVGIRVKLRLFAPGETLSALATGTIIERVANPPAKPFHDGYKIKLDAPLRVDTDVLDLIYVWPS